MIIVFNNRDKMHGMCTFIVVAKLITHYMQCTANGYFFSFIGGGGRPPPTPHFLLHCKEFTKRGSTVFIVANFKSAVSKARGRSHMMYVLAMSTVI